MFCEGLYLHTLLVIAFVSEEKILKWFYGIGWGIPLLLTIVYASARGTSPADTEYCWIEESKYTWILNGPVVLSMLLNFFFLINIVRVLVTKLRAVNSPESHQTRYNLSYSISLRICLCLYPSNSDKSQLRKIFSSISWYSWLSHRLPGELKNWWESVVVGPFHFFNQLVEWRDHECWVERLSNWLLAVMITL